MSNELCTKCGERPRWRGPNGTNDKLTMCEPCQRAYWREHKRAAQVGTDRTCTVCGQTFPMTEEYFYLRKERGTFRRQCKNCYDKREGKSEKSPRRKQRQQPLTPDEVRNAAVALTERVKATMAAPAQPAAEPGRETVKVLVVDRTHDKVYRAVVPIASSKRLSDTRQLEKLIAFYKHTGHVIVEV